jgi:hypothetical protein
MEGVEKKMSVQIKSVILFVKSSEDKHRENEYYILHSIDLSKQRERLGQKFSVGESKDLYFC